MPIIKVQPDTKHKPVSKVGSFQVDWEITKNQALLEKLIKERTAQFIRDMSLRGYELYRGVPIKVVSHEDGTPMAFYAIDWTGAPETAPDGGDMPKLRATSLEESKGMVEFRMVGMFWAPERMMERLVSRDEILKGERQAKNPIQFGYEGQPRTGSVLS